MRCRGVESGLPRSRLRRPWRRPGLSGTGSAVRAWLRCLGAGGELPDELLESWIGRRGKLQLTPPRRRHDRRRQLAVPPAHQKVVMTSGQPSQLIHLFAREPRPVGDPYRTVLHRVHSFFGRNPVRIETTGLDVSRVVTPHGGCLRVPYASIHVPARGHVKALYDAHVLGQRLIWPLLTTTCSERQHGEKRHRGPQAQRSKTRLGDRVRKVRSRYRYSAVAFRRVLRTMTRPTTPHTPARTTSCRMSAPVTAKPRLWGTKGPLETRTSAGPEL